MNEENFDYDELKEMVMSELNKTYTIEEALKEKEEELKVINESFEVLWNNFHSVKDMRKEAINNLITVKYKLILSNLLLMIIRYSVTEEVNNIINTINSAVYELKDERQILDLIEVSITKLQNQYAYSCNYELSNLLSLLYDKNTAIYNGVCDSVNASAARIRGINTQESNRYLLEKESIDEQINESTIKLGLKK